MTKKLDADLMHERREAHISRRWSQLYHLEKEWGERALKYLFMTNSGGAIATLGFLGAAPNAVNIFWAKLSLTGFALGVFFVGVATARIYHFMARLFRSWKSDAHLYYSGRKAWDSMVRDDEERSQGGFSDYVFPYLSFFFFVAGSALGAVGLFG